VSRLAAAALRLGLVEELERAGAFRTASVRAAFLQVARELFVPGFAGAEGLEAVYSNQLIVTKRDRDGVPLSSSSEPRIMAAMLEALELEEGMRVLEVGTGSGYNAALVKTLVGRRGRVVSVDLDRELASAARRALRAGGYPVRVVCGDGHDGYAPAAPYDRIVATASSGHVPRAWLDQLVEGGLLEVPLRLRSEGALAIGTFQRVDQALESRSVVPGRFMPLRGQAAGAVLPPVLTVRSQVGAGRVVVTRLGGSSLAQLSPRARGALLAVAGTRPRKRALGLRTASWPLGLYLSLEIPERRLVMRYADLAVGVIGRGGRSLALVEGRWEGGDRPTPQRLLAYGEADAEDYLGSLLEAWVARGRPGRDQLRMRITFSGRRSRISNRWVESQQDVLVPRSGGGDNASVPGRSLTRGDPAA
jgi:protein-L-isoaspartate(D-aspartate) O-methyltransferase